MARELEKAQKKYWYDRGFNKWDSGCVANPELCVFAEGWKAALEMVQDWYKDARGGFDLCLLDMLKQELGEAE